ncbi:MAG: hypothetical protein HFE67_03770 [Erysipelotrichaceae bacterium]|nr:hypothetical protein [Erysipelotrichaceae bacterium]
MRKQFLQMFLLLLLATLLWQGGISYEQSLHALKLWFETLVPSLFCVMVLVKVLFAYHAFDLVIRPWRRCANWLFGFQGSAFSYVAALFLLGFPAGAAFINGEVEKENLAQEHGRRLLSTCSFATPGFVIMTLGTVVFHSVKIGIMLFMIQVLSGLCLLLCTRGNIITANRSKTKQQMPSSMAIILKTAMIDSGKALYMMGGYLMLCMSLCSVIFHFLPHTWQLPLQTLAEFSSGCMTLAQLPLSLPIRLTLISMLLGFGGLCVHMQVISMSEQVCVGYGKYLCFRLFQAFLSGGLAYVFFS